MTRQEAESILDAELLKHGLPRKIWYRTIYLKSDHWHELRSRALEHHGRKCHKCPATRKLDVHHIRYSSIYDVEVTDLQILCRTCHDKEHAPVCTPKRQNKVRTARKKPKKAAKRMPLTKKQRRKLQAKIKMERVKEMRKRGCAPHKPPVLTVNGVRLFKP